jgi:hypothetical protein
MYVWRSLRCCGDFLMLLFSLFHSSTRIESKTQITTTTSKSKTQITRTTTTISMHSPSHSPRRSSVRPHNRRPFRIMPGLFVKKVLNSNLVHTKEAPSQQQVDDSGPVNIGTVMRNEKIENARSIASAIREQRQQKAATSSLTLHNALLGRLEAKLLSNEMECTELRKLAEARKRGIPVSLTSLKLGFEPETDSCMGSKCLLQKLNALVLMKEEACTKVRKLLTCARKRDTARMAQTATPRSILRKQFSFACKKSVSFD